MIHYVKHDATEPIKYPCCIVHGCNCIGAWGAGFVIPLGNKYPEAKRRFKLVHRLKGDKPGVSDLTGITPSLCICNLYSQRTIGQGAILYDALEEGLKNLKEQIPSDWTIQMPRIGCGLAGGRWERVEEIINRVLPDREIYVCDLPSRPFVRDGVAKNYVRTFC